MSDRKTTGIRQFVTAGLAVFALLFIVARCTGCTEPHYARPAAYGVELADCSESSATLADSIACENRVRARYGRPLRDAGSQ